jgi:hypothetical protein
MEVRGRREQRCWYRYARLCNAQPCETAVSTLPVPAFPIEVRLACAGQAPRNSIHPRSGWIWGEGAATRATGTSATAGFKTTRPRTKPANSCNGCQFSIVRDPLKPSTNTNNATDANTHNATARTRTETQLTQLERQRNNADPAQPNWGVRAVQMTQQAGRLALLFLVALSLRSSAAFLGNTRQRNGDATDATGNATTRTQQTGTHSAGDTRLNPSGGRH